MAFEKYEFDPVKYGVLWQKVEDLNWKVDRLEKKVDTINDSVNRSKGGFWLTTFLLSFLSAIAGILIKFFKT